MTRLILGPDRPLSLEQRARYDSFIARRELHEPVSRILGEREFYGRAFRVTPATLDAADTAAVSTLGDGGRMLSRVR